MNEIERRSAADVSASDGMDDWRVLGKTIQTSFRTGSMAAGMAFAARIAALADQADHHPDLTVTYPRVHVLLTTHDADGLTDRDISLARRVSAVATELDIEADPAAPTMIEVAIDAVHIPTVRPFWEAVLGYRVGQPDEVIDGHSRNPAFWFQQMDEPRTQRNRIHLDVHVPHDVVEARIAAALAAGGTLVSDAEAPAFWILADPEGNEACLCTWQGG